MYKYLLNGLVLGFAYVAPIGMQNIFVINTAIYKSKLKAYQVAFITIFFDIALALSCYMGVGALMERFNFLKVIILLIGSIAIIYIGAGLVLAAPKIQPEENMNVNRSFVKISWTCFAVTWLNPQAIIDVRQAKLGISDRVKVSIGQGLTNQPYRVLRRNW